jgi:hypothetical protein
MMPLGVLMHDIIFQEQDVLGDSLIPRLDNTMGFTKLLTTSGRK